MRIRSVASHIPFILYLAILLPFVASEQADAQPDLNFKRIRLDWPLVEVYLSVGCNGIKNYFLQRSDIVIREDGRELDDFGIWCPDPTSRCPITVSLVFDASDSMVGEGNAGAKDGGYNFVAQMDDVIDEGCVIFFNNNVTIFQHMTRDTAKLNRAVSMLPATGSTAVWDGIYKGLLIAQTQGSNTCRAVIVLTDGEDNSSALNLVDVVAYAVQHNIRVFPIGYGDKIREDQLMYLAQITGGKYYQTPDASQLAGIYREISTIMYEYFQECIITYEPRCSDGREHFVELGIPDLCGGSAWSTRSYIAPRDSSTFLDKELSIGQETVSGGATVRVPITLVTPYRRENFYPLTLDLAFDRRWLRLDRVEVPPGTLMEGTNVHIADLDKGGRIRFPDRRVIDGSGILCYAVFQTTTTSTALSVDLLPDSVAFSKGCALPRVTAGRVGITPSAPGVVCSMSAPDSLLWDAGAQKYRPEPFEVTLDLTNTGTLIARSGRLRLEVDSKIFEPVEPKSFEQSIGDIGLNSSRSVTWKLRAKAQGVYRSAPVCVRATFDNHADVVCCSDIAVPPAGMMLSCAMQMPQIGYDEPSGTFVPNPFQLDVTVSNIGHVSSDSLSALIQLPQGLYLESGDQYSRAISPVQLAPNEEGTVSWQLRVVSSMGGDRLPVVVTLRSGGQRVGACVDTLVLPWVSAGFTTDVTPLGQTVFCTGDSVILDAGAGYIAYRWSTGATSRTITVRTSGTYFVTVMDQLGAVGRSTSVEVQVYARPDRPSITRLGSTLYTTAVPPLQWYRDGTPIPGATSSQLRMTVPGTYTVETWTAEPCRALSDPLLVTVVSAHAPPLPSINALTVYPDPFTGEIALRIEARAGAAATMRIMNMLGQGIREERLHLRPGINTFHYDLSGLLRGVYIIRLRSGAQDLVRKIVRQ